MWTNGTAKAGGDGWPAEGDFLVFGVGGVCVFV